MTISAEFITQNSFSPESNLTPPSLESTISVALPSHIIIIFVELHLLGYTHIGS
jgi:hypothetical protein